MKKKVGIIRAASHTEITYSECTILKNFTNLNFTFFVESNEYLQLKNFHNDFNFVIIDKYFFNKNTKFYENFDILLFDVAELYLRQISELDTKSIKIFRIHNLNFWLNNNQTMLNIFSENIKNIFLFFSLKNFFLIIYRLFYQIFSNEKYYRSKILKTFNYLCFCNDNQYEYASNLNLKYKYAKLPVSYYIGKKNFISDSQKIKIIIPGEFIPEKKDFTILISALRLMNENAKDFEITIFKSKEKDNFLIDKILHSNTYCSFKIFEEFVEQDRFINILNSAHVMLSPIKHTVKYRGVEEKFGLSKTSGSYGDFYRYGLVPIFPKSYRIDPDASEYFELYNSSENLRDILIKISNRKYLNFKKAKIHDYLTNKNKTIINQYSFFLNDNY